MKECSEYWINVYDTMIYPIFPYYIGKPCDTEDMAKVVSLIIKKQGIKTLYRIHVRLK